MNKKYLYIFLVNAFITLCFNLGIVEGMIGGNNAVHGQFKYHVSLMFNGQIVCGGIIIDDLFVLTAAHCVIDDNLKFRNHEFIVVAGIIDVNEKNSGRVEVNVEKIYVPSEFSYIADPSNGKFNIKADIAVLKLEHPFGLNTNDALGKVKLPKVSECLSTYEYMDPTITGFGYNKIIMSKDLFGSQQVSYCHDCVLLKYAKTLVIPLEKCQRMFACKLLPSQLCVQLAVENTNSKGSTCPGDSGGPLVFDGTVIGVLSGSNGPNGKSGNASVFTKIGYYLSFINDVKLNKLSSNIRSASYEISRGFFNSRSKNLVETTTPVATI